MSPRPTRSRRSAAATIWARARSRPPAEGRRTGAGTGRNGRGAAPAPGSAPSPRPKSAPLSWLTSPCSTRASRRPLRARAAVAIRSSSARRSNMRTSTERSSSRRATSARPGARLPSSLAAASPLGRAARISSAMSPTQAVEHGGHQRPLLLGQALGGVEEKSARTVASRSPPAHARGRARFSCRGSDRPFLRHHSAALSDFG